MPGLSAHESPFDVVVVEDHVVITGPSPIAVSLTADCAEESGRRLIEAAQQVKAGEYGPGLDD